MTRTKTTFRLENKKFQDENENPLNIGIEPRTLLLENAFYTSRQLSLSVRRVGRVENVVSQILLYLEN